MATKTTKAADKKVETPSAPQHQHVNDDYYEKYVMDTLYNFNKCFFEMNKKLENMKHNLAWCAGIAVFNFICTIIAFIAAQGA